MCQLIAELNYDGFCLCLFQAFGLFALFAFVSICLLFVQLEGDLAGRVQIVYFHNLKMGNRCWHLKSSN